MPRKKEPTSLQRARKAHADRMKEQGYKAKTFWLSAGAAEALEQLKGEPNFSLDGKLNEGAAINAALIAAASRLEDSPLNSKPPFDPKPVTGFMATLTPEQKEAALAYRGDDTHPAPEKAEGRRVTSKATKAAQKPVEPSKPVKAKLDIPVGPQPFKSRLKGAKK